MARDGINDKVWRKLQGVLLALDKSFVKVGVLSGEGADTKTEDGKANMVGIAAIHEFGAPKANIPERSFIRRTLNEKEKELGNKSRALAEMIIRGDITHTRGLEILGTWAATEIKKTITKGKHIPPPLKPATIAAKGSDRPLVDTGRLVQSISHKVVKR